MSYPPLVVSLSFCLVLVAGPAPAMATVPSPAPVEEGVEVSPTPRERDALDRFSSVAAVVGIVLVAAAGFYIYGLIRKGL